MKSEGAKWELKMTNNLVGMEIELMILDENGNVSNSADKLLKHAHSDGRGTHIKKECATNIIEIASKPHETISEIMAHLQEELDYLIDLCRKNRLRLLLLGTYPGKFKPRIRQDQRYMIKQKIFGKERFQIAGRVTGFHCHYSLPQAIFNQDLRILRMLYGHSANDLLLNSYNFLIAADPALSLFMQSSPFYQGKHYGKDSRLIFYRGGKALRNPSGLYAEYEEFGGLPHYLPTSFDLINLIDERFTQWKALIKNLNIGVRIFPHFDSLMDTTWNPIKINPVGTFEQRGMDMNRLDLAAAIGIMVKFSMNEIQKQRIKAEPSEIAIKEPFIV
ncbi:hypothetical protein HY640_02265 [Candidatus Woesearchaeota archaeon]|nr:hypothetical protein [Candidatus Woesearchaeota archaeon]